MKIITSKPNKIVLAVSTALTLLTAAGVQAQSSLLEEVIVTAQKREQNAQDLSIAVSAFSGDQLKELGVTRASQLADYTAGVQINMEYGNAPTFTIRGINVNDFGAGTAPAATVYVDGIVKASNINSGPQLFDLERVEILKGPQGTLWGKNTTGGAVSVITRKPTREVEGYVQVGYGQYDTVELEGAVGGPITDTLSARLSIQSISSDGAYETVTFPGQPTPGSVAIDGNADSRTQFLGEVDPEPGDMQTLAVRAQFLWELDNVEVLGILHHATDKGDNPPTTSLFSDPDPYDEKTSAEFLSPRNSTFSGASLQVDWSLSDSTKLVSITGYDYFDRDEGIDTIGFNSIPAETAFTQIYLQEFSQFTQELRLESESGDLFWLVGAFYSDSELNQNDDDHYSIGYFTAPFNYRFSHENTTQSVFANAEYALSESVSFIAGVRYDDEQRDQPFYKLWFVGGPDTPTGEAGSLVFTDNQQALGGLPVPDQEYTTDGVSYRVGFDWRASDDMLLYYSHSKGFKSGGFRSDAATSNGELTAFDDEEVLSHEVGMKWDASDALRINVAVFNYDYQDPQQRVPTEVPPFGQLSTMTNLDSADVTGFEAEVLWAPVSGLELGASVSLLDTEISDASRPSVESNELAFAPDIAYTAFGRYEASMGDGLLGSLQVNVSHTGDHYLTVFNDDFEKQSYTLVGMNAGIRSEALGWSVSLYGQNLSNEIYATNYFGDGGVFISQPRQYGVRLSYDF